MKMLAGALVLLGIVIGAAGAGFAILLRDGLGPDMIASRGWLAVTRTLHVGWPALTLAVVLMTGGVMVWRRHAADPAGR